MVSRSAKETVGMWGKEDPDAVLCDANMASVFVLPAVVTLHTLCVLSFLSTLLLGV